MRKEGNAGAKRVLHLSTRSDLRGRDLIEGGSISVKRERHTDKRLSVRVEGRKRLTKGNETRESTRACIIAREGGGGADGSGGKPPTTEEGAWGREEGRDHLRFFQPNLNQKDKSMRPPLSRGEKISVVLESVFSGHWKSDAPIGREEGIPSRVPGSIGD